VTSDPSLHTPDLGGKATTRMVTDAVIAAIAGSNESPAATATRMARHS
jgi:tartrate dehydrogenase/decarboxylase/D-malate dehydrogenase